MLDSSLLYPDLPAWQNAASYSPSMAEVLRQAYQHLRSTPTCLDAFARVHHLLFAHLDDRMSARQRMHAYFLLGTACLAVDECSLALEYLGEALEIATLGLQDAVASAQLAYLHATGHMAVLDYRGAADDLGDTLDILRALGEDVAPHIRIFELTVLGRVAMAQFVLADYDAAARALSQAEPLLIHREQNIAGAGTIEWMWALIRRWQGQAPLALQHALVATSCYKSADAPNSYGRIQAVSAEIMLDLADYFDGGDARVAYLEMACPYVHRALALARESCDPMGECLALLAQIRLSRLQRQNEDRTHTLERLITIGTQASDASIVTQALTALGHEAASLGHISSAIGCYSRAVKTASESNIPAIGRWAERAMLLHHEGKL
jgi:tetratricopeptide (TPR) repeat protein